MTQTFIGDTARSYCVALAQRIAMTPLRDQARQLENARRFQLLNLGGRVVVRAELEAIRKARRGETLATVT